MCGEDIFGAVRLCQSAGAQQLQDAHRRVRCRPQGRLAILSATTPQNLALSIVTEDEKALTAAQGIGKKDRSAHHSGVEG